MSFMESDSWIYAVIAIVVVGIIVLAIFICTRRRSSIPISTGDESLYLLSESHASTRFTRISESDDPHHALMSCQLFLREKQNLQFVQSYSPMVGNSSQKSTYWFAAKQITNVQATAREKYLQSDEKLVVKVLVNLGLNSRRVDKLMEIFLDILLTLKDEACPFLHPVIDMKHFPDRDSVVVLTKFAKSGSIRDNMLRVKPFSRLHRDKSQRRKKSYQPGQPLPLDKIRIYAKQILLGINFLDKLGYPLRKIDTWLHAGNVLLGRDKCEILGYEVELLDLVSNSDVKQNDLRNGLDATAQLIFEMITGFPVNYAEGMVKEWKPGSHVQENSLKEIHFQYLNHCGEVEVSQFLQFICNPDKCSSLQASLYHPFFDRVTKFQLSQPEDIAVKSMKTLLGRVKKYKKHLNAADKSTLHVEERCIRV